MRLYGGDRTVRVGLGTVLVAPALVVFSLWLGKTPARAGLAAHVLFWAAIVLAVLGLAVIASALPKFHRPILKLVFEDGVEFTTPLAPNSEPMIAASGITGKKAVSGFISRVRVDETRGITAREVEVRLAAVTPPQAGVNVGERLAWRSGARHERIGAQGFDYVTFVTRVEFEDGTGMYAGPLLALANLPEGTRVCATLEVWWNNRKMDSREFQFESMGPPTSVQS